MQTKNIMAVVAAASLVAACQQPGGYNQSGSLNKQDVGTVLGGVAGGVAGYQFGGGAGKAAATIGGSLLGAYLGREIGASLDRADLAYYNQTSQKALETGQSGQALPWKNPQSGNSGTITPSNYYQTASGQYCREYQQEIIVGGKKQSGHGTACRQPDGSWQIVE